MVIDTIQRQMFYRVSNNIDEDLKIKGRFIVFEGLDGAGTTTQTALLANWLDANGMDVIPTKEPTDGLWGGIIRGILKGEVDAHPLSLCHAFMADRIDHIQKLQSRVLKLDSPVVLSDRYHLSYLAYQQKDTNKDLSWLYVTQQGLPLPDITVFLDASPYTCYERMKRSRITSERFENIEALERIYEGYISAIDLLIREGQNIKVVDGSLSINEIHEKTLSLLSDYFNK